MQSCKKSFLNLFLREIADFMRFFFKTSESDSKIVFYAENKNSYAYLEGLVEELIREYKQTLCYVTSDSCDHILYGNKPEVKAFFVDKLLPLFMILVNCKVLMMTLTDLEQFHIKRSINPVRYVYVFHSLVSISMMYRQGSFDHYDSILCAGPHHFKEIRKYEKHYGTPTKTLVKAGYYRLERIYLAYQKHLKEKGRTDKKIVLIAPSWGDGNVLESCGLDLVAVLLKAGFKVIVRPHPETVKHSPDLLSNLCSKFGSCEGFTFEDSVVTDDSIIHADVLISDLSGVALEYAFGTERPVLFLDVPPKVKNPGYMDFGIIPLELDLREKIGVVVSPDRLDDIPQVISKMFEDALIYKERIADLRNKHVYAFGRSSNVGAKHIIGLVN